MASRQPAAHRTIFLVDVEAFGDPSRTNKNQIVIREGLKHAWRRAFRHAGVDPDRCAVEDRGDGVFVLVPAEVPKSLFVDYVPLELVAALNEHNSSHPKAEQIRLRMAMHAGEVELDDSGSTGAAIMHAFRLLSSPPLKDALARSPGVLALITSDWFYSEVVRHSGITNPTDFREVRVSVKETTARAWVSLPGQPMPLPFLRGLRSIWSGSRV